MTRSTRDQPLLGGRKSPKGAPVRAPLPALLDGRPYVIRDSGGPRNPAHVTRSRKGTPTMTVPLGDSAAERRVRLHEMAHVRWTPLDAPVPPGVDFSTVNACEDRRIHRRLSEQADWKALLRWTPLLNEADWQKMCDRQINAAPGAEGAWDALEAARWVVAADGTAEGDRIRDELASSRFGWVPPIVDSLMDESGIRGRRPAFSATVALAEALEDFFRPDPPEDQDAPDPDGDMRRMLEDWQRRGTMLYGEGKGGWGRMDITTPPLVVPLPRQVSRVRRHRATDTGAIPRNWHRAVSDGAVFSRRRPAPGYGGTVVIDQSGSMQLDPAEVLALMAAFPAVTVATYAGDHTRGELRIIARNGRRASDSDCYLDMGGNTVDGPALDWLSRQAEPRVWVSDGLVVGANGACTTALLLEVRDTCKRGKIRRADTLGELLPDVTPDVEGGVR